MGKGFEDPRLLLGGDADPGIPDLETQGQSLCAALPLRDPHHHLAVLGELDGVAHQVGENLPQSTRIAPQDVLQVRRQLHRQFQALGVSPGRHQFAQVLHQIPQAEGRVVQVQLAGLDLGEIQDIVDDTHQRLAGAADSVHEAALLGIQVGFQHQIGHTQHAVHGGANLVTHGGQKITLSAASFLGGLFFSPGPLDVFAQFDLHKQERLRQPPHLIIVAGRQGTDGFVSLIRLAKVVEGQFLGVLGEYVQGPGYLGHQQPGRQHAQAEN